MAYIDKKVPELRDMCAARGLSKAGKRNDLIHRLEQQQQQQQQQQENFIKQEINEMQIDSVSIIQQQQQQQQHQQHQQHQEVPTSPHVSGTGPPSHEHIKYEYEMNIDEIPTEDSSIEQNISSNVVMSNEYPQSSIDPVEQQQKIDQPPTVSSSVATSPIVTQNDASKVEVSSNIEQDNHDQSKLSDSTEKSYSTYQKDDARSEIEREITRLMTERKRGTLNSNNSKIFSRGIMMNQGQTNGVPYDYDFLLDTVQKSEIYNDGEIPEWLRYYYDTTLGTKKFGESECLRNIGIPIEDFFIAINLTN